MDNVKLASMEALREIVETKTAAKFIWPNEKRIGRNKYTIKALNGDVIKVPPLLIDAVSATMLLRIYDSAPKEEYAKKFSDLICGTRLSFINLFEHVANFLIKSVL